MGSSAGRRDPRSGDVSAGRRGPRTDDVSAGRRGPRSDDVSAGRRGPRSDDVSAGRRGPRSDDVVRPLASFARSCCEFTTTGANITLLTDESIGRGTAVLALY